MNVPEAYHLERDPKDSKYLNLAIAAGAGYLVTDDQDLLELMNPAAAVSREFRNQFPSIRIVEPAVFEQTVLATSQDDPTS